MNAELEYTKQTGLATRKRSSNNYHKFTDEFVTWMVNQLKNCNLQNVSGMVSMEKLMLYYTKSKHDFNTPVSEVLADMLTDS